MWSLVAFAPSVLGFGSLCKGPSHLQFNGSLNAEPVENLKIVFLGDQGLQGGVKKPVDVLKQVKEFGPDFVIHSGDLDYVDNPNAWEVQLDSVLGSQFPYFFNIGNHDLPKWTDYATKGAARLKRFGADQYCTGEYGVNMACNYKGFLFVLSGVGTLGSGHANYINNLFSSTPSIWKACTWHKNQHFMQTGDKSDETGWEVYDSCRRHGAIIATGHEHSYSRTYNMADFSKQTVADRGNVYIKQGQTIAFVSGLGGTEIRPWKNGLQNSPWWASVAASDNGANYGALYCTFYLEGSPDSAECAFKDISGKVWDKFTLQSENSAKVPSKHTPVPESCHGKFHEFPITHGGNDGRVVEGELVHGDTHLALQRSRAVLKFSTSLRASDAAKVDKSHLQIYGSKSAQCAVNFSISTSTDGLTSSSASVQWMGPADDFEGHDVWVSPDISGLVKQALTSSSTGDVTLFIDGDVLECELEIYAYDSNPCLAPTLAVEMLPERDSPACTKF